MSGERYARALKRYLSLLKTRPPLRAVWQALAREALRDYLSGIDSRQRAAAYCTSVGSERPLLSIVADAATFGVPSLRCLSVLANAAHGNAVELIVIGLARGRLEVIQAYYSGIIAIDGAGSLAEVRNAAYRAARGEFIFFVRDDAEVGSNIVAQMLAMIGTGSAAAITGGLLIDPQGYVLEAGLTGSIDGVLRRLGTGDDPSDSRYQTVQRARGFIDGPLLVARSALDSLGGFDIATGDLHVADLCLRARGTGLTVRYHPALAAFDWSTLGKRALRRSLDANTTSAYLRRHPDRAAFACDSPSQEEATSRRVLLLEDRVPHAKLGKGYPRSRQLIRSLVSLGYDVTLYPIRGPNDLPVATYATLPHEVHVLHHSNTRGLAQMIARDVNAYDVVVVARPYNMRLFRKALALVGLSIDQLRPPVIYDAEALFALRGIAAERRDGRVLADAEISARIDDEVQLAAGCAAVISVSRTEASEFVSRGLTNVFVLGHALDVRPTEETFGERHGLLFVGSLVDPDSPNVDGLMWFVREVLPLLATNRAFNGTGPVLFVAGGVCEEVRRACENYPVFVAGTVDDLRSFYAQARVFVAPARYAAGIPLKVFEAAAYGVPVVASSLLAQQLEWENDCEILTADDAPQFAAKCLALSEDKERWQSIRRRALDRVVREASVAAFTAKVKQAMECVL